MEIYSILGSVFTVLSFIVFIGIVAWACSSRRRQAFDAAAQEPFALPDEADGAPGASAPGARR
jgi:cytochrome c oxidase cbb3-type subunit IV